MYYNTYKTITDDETGENIPGIDGEEEIRSSYYNREVHVDKSKT